LQIVFVDPGEERVMQSRQVICTKVLIVAVAATSSAVSIAADAD